MQFEVCFMAIFCELQPDQHVLKWFSKILCFQTALVGGGVGWFAQSFLCKTQPLCCVVLGLGFWQNVFWSIILLCPKFLELKIGFGAKLFWSQNLFWSTFFWTPNFFYPKFFYPKFCYPKLFWIRIFWT